jgi:hypothetical protein
MAVTVGFIDGTNGTGITLSTADVATGWTGPTADTSGIQIQGTDCLSLKQASGLNRFYYNYGSTIDMTQFDRHFYCWGQGFGRLDTYANGGIRLFMGTTTTNFDEWFVDGSNTYKGGWKCFVVNPQYPSDFSNGSGVTLTTVQYFGITFNCTAAFTGNNKTIFVDAIRVGSGLRITGGTSSDTGKFSEIHADDTNSNNQYGVVRRDAGAYIVQGELIFGNTGSATSFYFSDNNATVIFDDQRISSTLPKIKVEAHASATTTHFQLGDKVGSGSSTVGTKSVNISSAPVSATASFTYVNGSPDTITRSTGSFITDGFKHGQSLRVSGTTNNDGVYTLNSSTGVAATTLTLTSSGTLTNEGPVTSTLLATRRFDLLIEDADLQTLNIYSTTFNRVGEVHLGSTSTALSSTTIEIVDSAFSDTNEVVKNITTSSPLYLRNKISFNVNNPASKIASLNLYDSNAVDVDEFQVIEGPKFESTATAGTRTVTNHTFTNTTANKPYITIQNSASTVWNMDDPNNGSGGRPTIGTDKSELAFAGTADGDVNERYVVTWKVEEPDGTDINLAKVKIVETAPSVVIANQNSTDSNGDASSTYLREFYEPSGASTITSTEHTPNAFKVYKYGFFPDVRSASIDQPVTNNIAMLTDTFYVTGSAATAITNGDVSNGITLIEASTNEHSLIKFTGGGGGTLSNNDTITGSGSTADGQLVGKIIEGDDTAGTILLDNRDANSFTNGDTLSNGGGWTAAYTNSSEQRFHWICDAGLGNDRTAQNVYDYQSAKLEESPIDTVKFWDDVVTWGRSAYGFFLEGSGSKFKTNSTNSQGWAIANLSDLSEISQFTNNSGTAFLPQSSVTLQITVVDKDNNPIPTAQTAIFKTSDDTQLMNEDTETVTTGFFVVGVRYIIINVGDTDFTAIGAASNTVGIVFTATGSGGGTTGTASNGIATATYIYTANTPIYYRIRKSSSGITRYVPFSGTGTITSSGFSVTATLYVDSNAT